MIDWLPAVPHCFLLAASSAAAAAHDHQAFLQTLVLVLCASAVMTRFFETAFQVIPTSTAQLPAELAYQKDGVMFGNRLIQASRSANIADPQLRTDHALHLLLTIRPCCEDTCLTAFPYNIKFLLCHTSILHQSEADEIITSSVFMNICLDKKLYSRKIRQLI